MEHPKNTFERFGYRYRFEITMGTIIAIKKEGTLGDLLNIEQFADDGTASPLIRLSSDILYRMELMDRLLADQYQEARDAGQLDEKQVEMMYDGATFVEASAALFAALESFFQAVGRPNTAKAIRRVQDVIDAAIRKSSVLVETIATEQIAKITGKPKKTGTKAQKKAGKRTKRKK